jgi:ADP-heptose:LPS heptosyltransferase
MDHTRFDLHLCLQIIGLKRILIIRFSSIGDIVLTTPVVRCVRQQLNAEVHILCKPAYSSIWQANPYVHKVHVLQDDFDSVIKALKTANFDLIIDLHKNIRSLKIRMALSKPFFTFHKLNLQKWVRTNLKIDFLPKKHIVDRYFEGLAPLGVYNDGCGLDYFIPSEEEVQPDQYKQNLQPFIAVSLGAAHATKRMPIALLHQILRNIDAPIFLLGAKDDKASGELLIDLGLQGRAVLLAGALSLGQTASIIAQSAVLLTADTGLMHIGAALGIPLITVWGNTIPEFGMYPYTVGTEGRYKIFEVEGLSCRPCSKIGFNECPKGHFKCMNLQPADQIEMALRQYLD